MESRVIDNIMEVVKKKLCDDNTGHDWEHSYRVYVNSIKIANEEIIASEKNKDIDFELVALGALLHDIADHKFGYSDSDREKIIEEILLKENISQYRIKKIIKIVNNVSFSKGNIPNSLEGKIVQDADRLEAIGAIGIARAFCFGGYAGRPLYDSLTHFHEKLYFLKDKMNTDSGKKMAESRHEFLKTFEAQFNSEWNI
ncbi:MAG: HD domain-containing protein [Fusobacteriaceae bacterium]